MGIRVVTLEKNEYGTNEIQNSPQFERFEKKRLSIENIRNDTKCGISTKSFKRAQDKIIQRLFSNRGREHIQKERVYMDDCVASWHMMEGVEIVLSPLGKTTARQTTNYLEIPTAKKADDSKPKGYHNVFTDYPQDPNCEAWRMTKTTRAR